MKHRVIPKEELSSILVEHSKWLVDQNTGARADLRDADLSSANLSYANLRYANLRYADLRYADLLIFQFNRHTAYFTADGNLQIGCRLMTITDWEKQYEDIGKSEGYSDVEIKAYGQFINICLDTIETKAEEMRG